jgi:Fe-S oxidoreductase
MVWVYEHCHQKHLAETSNLIGALELIPKLQTKIIDGGCCGMAGYFGYKHSKVSEIIAHDSLDNFVDKFEKQDVLIATGTSCRKQFLDIFKIQSTHLSTLLVKLT